MASQLVPEFMKALGRAATGVGDFRSHPRWTASLKTGVTLTVVMCIGGCGVVESTEAKQLKACVTDIQLGLNDPNSLEVLSTSPIEVSGGNGHRLKVSFTAKNKMGGRVRGEEICGFKSKADTVLDPDDRQNSLRSVARGLRELGIKVK